MKASKEKVKQYNRTYNLKNKELKKNLSIVYRAKNKLKLAVSKKKYYDENREVIVAKKVKYFRKKLDTDPTFRLINALRTRQRMVLKGRCSTTRGLGCTTRELRVWIESHFQEGMLWSNYGDKADCWSLDHTIPLSTHEKDKDGSWDVDSEYNKKLINYTNLKPMWHIENIKKGDTVLL